MLRRELLGGAAALLGSAAIAGRARAASTTLVFSHADNVGPLHPHRYAPNQMFGQALLYEPLVRYAEGGRIEPCLASGWTVAKDGRSYDFVLREDVRFTDGQPFDAHAVKANIDAVIAERDLHGWLGLVGQIEGVDVPDTYVVRLRLKEAYQPVLYELSLVRPFRFLSPAVLQGAAEAFRPVGTGPWTLVETLRGESDRFARNESYWGSRPGYEQLLVRVIPDPNTRVLALETGEIDLVYGADQIGSEAFARLDADPRFQAAISPPRASRLVAINTSRAPTDDPAVRRAILQAVDRASLVRNVLLDMERPADTLFAPNVPFADVALEPVLFDRDAADASLDAAGWTAGEEGMRARDGRELALDFCFMGTDAVQKSLAEAIQSDLRKAGFQVRLVGEDEGSFAGRQRSGEFGLIFADSWGAPYDPHAFMSSMRVPSHADFQAQSGLAMKAEIDRRIGEVLVGTDDAARRENYRWLMTTLHEQAVYLPISYLTISYVHAASVAGVEFGPTLTEIPFDRMMPAAA
ncbi:nickel ABC transporter substrate-binding protein [Geminicoccus roseus]|uniref:nickel ABC transporter substrate-binding protein n=1 Tax=Geminicoccus roseus TaxID=404900 RepID=UPI00040B2A08|nr:nickel ABC transporter substrate-binding protein [Geminicoccus roseus]